MRIYGPGKTGTLLSSGSISKEDLRSLESEYTKASQAVGTDHTVSVSITIGPLFDTQSPLTVEKTEDEIVVGLTTNTGFISVFNPKYQNWSDCLIDPSLEAINFTSYGFETVGTFLEENVSPKDYDKWRQFLLEKETNLRFEESV